MNGKRIDRRHIEHHARRAISKRLGYWESAAIKSISRDGRDLIMTLNSGGNACEVEWALRFAGYDVEHASGCTVRVRAS